MNIEPVMKISFYNIALLMYSDIFSRANVRLKVYSTKWIEYIFDVFF